MSKTSAIALASSSVQVCPFGRGWQVIGPYFTDRLAGPSTEVTASSYADARLKRAEWAARVAVRLIGLSEEAELDVQAYFHGLRGGSDMRGAVEYAITRQGD